MSSRSDRRRERAIERQDAGYPEPLARSVRSVSPEEWVSQFEAAERLRVSDLRIGALVSAGTLEPVHDPAGRAGVARASVDREYEARSRGGVLTRVKYAMTDTLKAFARGI